jgi:hypothetical protein
MTDPAMWSRARLVADSIVSDWMMLDATERTMDKLVAEIEVELEKAFDAGMKAVAVVTPLFRIDALEKAAKLVEDEDGNYSWAGEHRNMALLQQHGRELAAAIRALKEQP